MVMVVSCVKHSTTFSFSKTGMETTTNMLLTHAIETMESISQKMGERKEIDLQAVVVLVMETMERQRQRMNQKILVTQNEACGLYGTSVIRTLKKRGLITPCKFDTKEFTGRTGEKVTKGKGVIYYRLSDIDKAVEDGNILKGCGKMMK